MALLFDEVEDVFPPVSADAAQLLARLDASDAPPSASVSGKAWVNQILETNPVPVIWVTNRIEQIDPAFRRRFQYHLELKSPPPGAREALVARALTGIEVGEGFAATVNASTTAYSATNEVSGTGYTAGGVAVTFGTAPSSTSTTAFITPSASITFSSVTLATAFDAVLIYNSTQSNKAVSVHTFGSQTVTAGTFTLTMPTNDSSTGLIRLA